MIFLLKVDHCMSLCCFKYNFIIPGTLLRENLHHFLLSMISNLNKHNLSLHKNIFPCQKTGFCVTVSKCNFPLVTFVIIINMILHNFRQFGMTRSVSKEYFRQYSPK